MITLRKNELAFLLLALLLSLCSSNIHSQEKSKDQKVKKLTVIEEKHDGKAVSTNKESETTYDVNGNIIEQILYKSGEVDSHFKYEYDANNNKIKETEYDKKGAVYRISEYKIQNGQRIEKTVYDSQKRLLLKKTYQYTFF
jgi:hypothetical protein